MTCSNITNSYGVKGFEGAQFEPFANHTSFSAQGSRDTLESLNTELPKNDDVDNSCLSKCVRGFFRGIGACLAVVGGSVALCVGGIGAACCVVGSVIAAVVMTVVSWAAGFFILCLAIICSPCLAIAECIRENS